MTAVQAPVSTNPTPKLFARQRQLLQLLSALGGASGKTDFQKLLFLYCQEPANTFRIAIDPWHSGGSNIGTWA